MLISPTPHRSPPSATVLLTALSAVGVCAYYDRENCAILAHAADVPQAEALNHVHVMLGWTAFPSKQPDADRARVTATIRQPDGTPEPHHQAGAFYRTARLRPIADEAQAAARAVAAWMAGRSAGLMLLSALAEYGITPGDGLSIGPDRFDIPLPFTHGLWGRLSIADRARSVRHALRHTPAGACSCTTSAASRSATRCSSPAPEAWWTVPKTPPFSPRPSQTG